jgi:phage baseplate assembly protein W
MANPPIVWSDLDENLVQDVQGNLALVVNEQSVRDSIDNILGTNPGERIFLPQFASGLKSILFEPMTQQKMDNLANSIKNSIETWDNRVSVQNVACTLDPDNNYVAITVTFSIPGVFQLLTQTTTI